MTKAKTIATRDIKVWSDAQVEIHLESIIFPLLESKEQIKWKEVYEMRNLRVGRNYTQHQLQETWKVLYAKFYGISWKEKSQHPNWGACVTRITRMTIVACIADEKKFKEYSESGKTVYWAWNDINNSKKKMKAIADGKESVAHKQERQRKELKEDVENAEEYMKATVKPSKVKREHELEEEPTSWTAPQVDANTRWISECRSICREEPKLFIRMIESLAKSDLLSNDTLDSVRLDLKIVG